MDDHEAGRQDDGGHRFGKVRLLALVLASALGSTVVSLALSFTSALGHAGYPLNGGFEDGISYWNVSYGATFITVTTPVSSGNWAASLTRQDIASEVSIYQDVDVHAGATYTLTGWAYLNEPAFDYVCLRIQWPGSTELDEEDCVYDLNDYYRPLTVGPTIAPLDATAARIKAVAGIRTANPPNPVYFDEISLTCSLTPRLYSPLLLKSYPR
jgi:hypothetical protein